MNITLVITLSTNDLTRLLDGYNEEIEIPIVQGSDACQVIVRKEG